jgi:hypothetical protein
MSSRGQGDPTVGCLLVILIGVVWIILATLPWSAYIILAVVVACIIGNRNFRQNVIDAFTTEVVRPSAANVRHVLLYLLFILGGASAFVCTFWIEADEAYLWLVPLLLLSLAFRLCALSAKSGRWHNLQIAFSENILELLVIAGLVILACSIALWRFHAVALDSMTLAKLKEWDRFVYEKHEWFEHHKPGLRASVALFVVVIVARFVAELRPTLKEASDTLTSILVAGVKWTERSGTAIAVAASLTFLASQPGGPLKSIGLAIRDAKVNYEVFQGKVRAKVDRSMRQALVQKAWDGRPPHVRGALDRAAKFCEERKKFEELQAKATERFEIAAETEPFPLTERIARQDIRQEDVPGEPADDWTPKDIQQAESEADALLAKDEIPTHPESGDATDEMAEKILDNLSPADKLFEHSPVTALLKEHYPVFGEFLDAVSSSITEASYKTIRDFIVSKVSELRKNKATGSLPPIVSEQVAAAMSPVELKLAPLDETWSRANDSRVASFRAAVDTASIRLEAKAVAKAQTQVEDAARSAEAVRELMAKVGSATGSIDMLGRAEAISKHIVQLEALGKRWPALDEPSKEQSERLAHIHTFSWDIHGPSSPASVFASDNWATPLSGIFSIRHYCNEQLLTTISGAKSYPELSARIKLAMGDRYEVYDRFLQERIRKAEAAQAERERLQRRENERRREEQREEQRRMEEMRRTEHERIEVP